MRAEPQARRRRDADVRVRDDRAARAAERMGTQSTVALLALQRSAGNRAVARALSGLGAAPRALIQRDMLSDGTDTDTLRLPELKQRWDAAVANGNVGDLEILRRVLERLSRKRKHSDEDDEIFEETIFAKTKLVKGATYSTARDEADYLARNPELRPPMPGGLFNTVYAAAAQHAIGIKRVPCVETPHAPPDYVYFQSGSGQRETDATGAVLGTGKRPPVCHILPYNHLMRAWLDLMSDKKYSGVRPGAAGYDDAHKELAWGDVTNLRPGHSRCNSSTSRRAVGGNYSQTVETKVRTWLRHKGWL